MQQWQTATRALDRVLTKLERSFLSLLKLNCLDASCREHDWRRLPRTFKAAIYIVSLEVGSTYLEGDASSRLYLIIQGGSCRLWLDCGVKKTLKPRLWRCVSSRLLAPTSLITFTEKHIITQVFLECPPITDKARSM